MITGLASYSRGFSFNAARHQQLQSASATRLDDQCGTVIPSDRQSTNAAVHSFRQGLLDPSSANAQLRRLPVVHRHVMLPSFFRFGSHAPKEQSTGSVMKRLCEHSARECTKVQILVGDCIAPRDELLGLLPAVIESLVRDVRVSLCDEDSSPFTILRAFLLARQRLLPILESVRRPLRKLMVGDLFTSRERGKRREPEVDSDNRVLVEDPPDRSLRRTRADVALEVDPPLSNRIATDRRILDYALDRPVEVQLDETDLRHANAFVLDNYVFKIERIVASLGAKAWETWILTASDSPEESLVCEIESAKSGTLNFRRYRGPNWIGMPKFHQLCRLLEVRNRLALPSVGRDPLLQCGVVEGATLPSTLIDGALLRTAWVKSVFVGSHHRKAYRNLDTPSDRAEAAP